MVVQGDVPKREMMKLPKATNNTPSTVSSNNQQRDIPGNSTKKKLNNNQTASHYKATAGSSQPSQTNVLNKQPVEKIRQREPLSDRSNANQQRKRKQLPQPKPVDVDEDFF
ncbi:unnamed protein product [Rotaria sp. Silwood1]|nr:unnamed protein product [Rotaria sp. Silwood1]CAF0993362.1 unnamed protein product [Rotaria sp. Silwood1]CAF3405740.1 unnamed protein product [Rotaria sp. Silwood1]CAF3405814.1 unnamed protein product [Rotaria sp. Silwood1]CAF4693566.1 unnamed protein product [Rotaria sp. Silwood1]